MEKSLIRNLSSYIGGGIIAISGLLFVFIGDIKAKLPSTWLFGAIIFAIGACIFALVADTQKDKLVVFYILKSVGLVLSIGFVIYLFTFLSKDIATSYKYKTLITIIPAILSILGIGIQGFNIAFNIKNGAED